MQEEKDTIKNELANALEIQPAEIMDYRQTVDGTYTVVLFNFQKFTQVEPKEISLVPADMRGIYQRPYTGKKTRLAELAEILGLEIDPKEPKKVYVEEINHYRLNH